MKKKEKTIPFSQALNALLTEEQVPVHLLFQLSDLSDEDFAKFTKRWTAVSDDRRYAIVRHLADLSEENYVVNFEPIFAHCLRDPQPGIRASALDGLWDSSTIKHITPIIRLLETDSDQQVRAAAAKALTHYLLMAQWNQIPQRFAQPITTALFAAYEKLGNTLAVQKSIVEALGAADDSRVPHMIEQAYESGEFDLQLGAVFAMGNSADARWLHILIAEMTNPAAEMRAEAARAAGVMGKSDAISGLAQLASDEDQDVALVAVEALGQIGGGEAARILTELAENPEYEYLHEAIDEALEEMEWLDGQFELFTWPEDGESPDDDEDMLPVDTDEE